MNTKGGIGAQGDKLSYFEISNVVRLINREVSGKEGAVMIKLILFDISGVLYENNKPIRRAVDVVNQLQQESTLSLLFVTNSSQMTEQMIYTSLTNFGFHIEKSQLFTPTTALKHLLKERGLTPFCIIHPNLEPEFISSDNDKPNAVVVTDAAEQFNYSKLNSAFELLLNGAPLLGIGRNKYFKRGGKFMLDAGPFIVALEYAADVEAEIIGKPSASFFMAAVDSVGCRPEQTLMIGDDVEADVNGALSVGLQAVLVKTGKYRKGDEQKINSVDAKVVDSVVGAVSAFLEH